jgi:hypothetical protein
MGAEEAFLSLGFGNVDFWLGPLTQARLVEVGVRLVFFEVIFDFLQVKLRLVVHFVIYARVLLNF